MWENRGKFPKMRALPYDGWAGRRVREGMAGKGVDKARQQECTPGAPQLS